MVSSLIPPKIATPAMVPGGKGGEPSFYSYVYSRLPKGRYDNRERFAKAHWLTRFYHHPDAGSRPIVVIIGGLMTFGYTLHYLRHFQYEKRGHH